MNCEICGTEIKGEPYKTKIDNSVMLTCKECSRYGKVQKRPQPATPKKKINTNNNNRNNYNNYNNNSKPQKRSYSRKDEPEYEVVEDYNVIIRKAREQQKLTQKQLGEKINERESVVAHIESGKMIPELKMARKLESILKIKIIEKRESDEEEFKSVARYGEVTLGDIARIKRK